MIDFFLLHYLMSLKLFSFDLVKQINLNEETHKGYSTSRLKNKNYEQ